MRPSRFVTVLTVIAWIATGPRAPAATLYVAPHGSDANAGTQQKPLASLEAARDAARRLRAADPESPAKIVLRGGVYWLGETVVFDLRDSSAKGADLEIAAFPGEHPVLSGAAPLPGGWHRAPRDLARVPEAARGHVWMADVPPSWPVFRTLFEDSVLLPRASTPGYNQLAEAPKGAPAIDLTHLYLPQEALQAVADFRQAEMVVVPQWPWVVNILPMTKVDRATGMVRTAVPATYALNPPRFGRFPRGTLWIENVLEGLDAPGKWVLDIHRHKLYLWPPDGTDPAERVVAPRLTELIRVEGKIDRDGPVDVPVRGIVFRGLTFTQGDRWPWRADKTGWGFVSDWEMFDRPTALLRFRGAEACRVEDCRFIHSGGAGIRLDLYCQHVAIARCELGDLGGVGVLLAGYGLGLKDVNRENVVTDCQVHHVGRLLWHSAGIWAWQSGHNHIVHNHVCHTPYSGILVAGRTEWDPAEGTEGSRTIRRAEFERVLNGKEPTWQNREPLMHGRDNLVAYNDLDHCMEVLGDGNAIYVSGTGGGNQVRNNFIHDIPAVNINGSIRCDDDQDDVTIEDNVITRVCGEGVIIKGRNTIRNNIFYDVRNQTPDGESCVHQRGYFVLPDGVVKGSVVERNICVSRIAGQAFLYERPEVPDKCLLRSCQVDDNVYFNTAQPGWAREHLDAQRRFGIEQHSIEADPQFIDPARDDFRLKPTSPARKLGFRPIDISQLGPRESKPPKETVAR